MGDQDHTAGERLQVMLKPGHALGVQVVGRLVQQQHIRLGQQQPGQGHAALLTARQLGHAGIVRRTTQSVHGHFDAAVDVPDISGVDLLLEGGHLLHQLVGVVLTQLGGDGVEAVQPLFFLAPGLDVFAYGQGVIQMRLLLQIAALDPVGGARLAREFGVDPGHDLEQRRLARAVDADHADLGVRVERQPDVLEHLLAAGIGLGQALHLKNILRGHRRASCRSGYAGRSAADVAIAGAKGNATAGRRANRTAGRTLVFC